MRGFLGILRLIHAKYGGNLCADAMAGRFLIALSILLLAATPFTEHLWTFDRFLHGGQDFEFSLLALIVFFCLVLLLARYAQHGLSVVLTVRLWLHFVFQSGKEAALAISHRSIAVCPTLLRHRPLYRAPTIPLRI